jgi:hypothetical protein
VCDKIDRRVSCYYCGYPLSESLVDGDDNVKCSKQIEDETKMKYFWLGYCVFILGCAVAGFWIGYHIQRLV